MPDSPIRMDGGSPSVVPSVSGAGRSGRGVWPAGRNSRSSRKLNVVSTSEVEKMDSLDSSRWTSGGKEHWDGVPVH